jgi:hypothetical protein
MNCRSPCTTSAGTAGNTGKQQPSQDAPLPFALFSDLINRKCPQLPKLMVACALPFVRAAALGRRSRPSGRATDR